MANNQQVPTLTFRSGEQGETQRLKFQKFQRRGLQPTRYVDLDCLRNLGLLDSVRQLLQSVNLWNLCREPQPIYETLTFEFLSSFAYITPPGATNQLSGVAKFRMFGIEHQLPQTDIARLLGFCSDEGVHLRVPDNFGEEAFNLWHSMTNIRAGSYDHLNATHIHNPAIRYFHRILSNTIFARDSNHKLNSKELFFLHCAFTGQKINAAPFLLAHIHSICARGGKPFYFGGLVTSIAIGLNYGAALATLPSMAPALLTLDHCKAAHLIYEREDGRFHPVIRNTVYQNIILPNRDRIDPSNRANWLFDPEVPAEPAPAHEDQAAAAADDIQEELDSAPPVHDIPGSSSAPPPINLEDILRALHMQNQMNAALERRQAEQFESLCAQNAQILIGQRNMNERLDEALSELNTLRIDMNTYGFQDTDAEATPTRRSRTRSRGRGHQ